MKTCSECESSIDLFRRGLLYTYCWRAWMESSRMFDFGEGHWALSEQPARFWLWGESL